jgi:F-type H+-transporting ATPase subunit delta
MSEFRASYRYALALIGVAQEMKKLDEVDRDLKFIEKLTAGEREFTLFLKSPVITAEKKKRVLREILQGHVGEITMKFVDLLAAKSREGLLPEIIRQFARLRDDRLGIVNVSARTAVKFTPAQEETLVRQLEGVTKKRVRISYVVDPSIKGGFIVRHDDTVWDASVQNHLKVLRQRFIEGTA